MSLAWDISGVRAYEGDAVKVLKTLPGGSAQTCVTSPPYFGGLRDYGRAGQLGREATVELYVRHLVDVMSEVRRVLRPEGTLWLNLGDTYGPSALSSRARKARGGRSSMGLRPKNLIGVPWRVALALQEDGWLLRSDVIWRKPNAAPESMTDRFTRSHEHVFLLAPSPRYFFDAEAVHEPAGSARTEGVNALRGQNQLRPRGPRHLRVVADEGDPTRNCRDVWDVALTPFHGKHLATYPTALVERCVLAGTSAAGCCGRCGESFVAAGLGSTRPWAPSCGCQVGAPVPCTVLDPFFGAATTGLVAARHGRCCVGIELNPQYLRLGQERMTADALGKSTPVRAAA